MTTKHLSRICWKFPTGQNYLHWLRGEGRQLGRGYRPECKGCAGWTLQARRRGMAGGACQRGTVLGPGAEGPEAGQSRGAAFPPGGLAVGYRRDRRRVLGEGRWRGPEAPGTWSRLLGAVRSRVTEQHMCPRRTEGQETQPGKPWTGRQRAAKTTRPCASKSRTDGQRSLSGW